MINCYWYSKEYSVWDKITKLKRNEIRIMKLEY